MKLAFDGKRAVQNYTGIGNYSRLALESLLPLVPEGSELTLYAPKLKPNERLQPLLERGVEVRTPDTLMGRMLPHWWRSSGLSAQLRRDKPDLYHGLSNELPAGIDVPSVVTIHDLIFLRHPEFYHRADVEICTRKFEYAARKADLVIAISERTKADLEELFGVEPAKIRIVYQGCSPMFWQSVSAERIAEVRKKYGRYIVGVGTIEARKNQMLTLRALAQLPKDVNLVLAGRRTPYADELDREAARLGLTDRVHYVQGASMQHIVELYAASALAAYPSFYEGFGIPMLEAVAAGVPVVAATGSCLEEAGGPGAIYVDPRDVDAFADAARRMLNDADLAAKMVADGREYIRRFDPANFGRGLIDVYNELI